MFKQSFIDELSTIRGTYYNYEFNNSDYKTAIYVGLKQNQKIMVVELLKSNTEVIRNFLENDFLGKLYANSYQNWFDIENAYFYELVSLKNQVIAGKSKYLNSKLELLNGQFLEIKNELFKYLNTIEPSISDEVQSFINRNTMVSTEIYVINFNYTNTFDPYLVEKAQNTPCIIYHIHGSLEDNNIIFGYGNDQNSHYEEIKELEIDEFLTHFKTFEYLRHFQYSKIQEALEKLEQYEVLVLGHSLGSTDKTLLDEILNPDKCQKIRFFKRGDLKESEEDVLKEFTKQTYAASRILTNEKMLRKKIINYQDSWFFP